MVTPGHGFVLLLASGGGSTLPGGPFRLSIPHQTRVQNPLSEVHALRNPGPDILGPADSKCLRKNDMGKDERLLYWNISVHYHRQKRTHPQNHVRDM